MIIDNFKIGCCWCDISCIKGHEVEIININRGHYGVCRECKKYIFLGSNLKSDWRYEDKKIWKHNSDLIRTFDEVDKK